MFGELIALLTAFLWSGTSFAFTEASKRIGSLQLNVSRMSLALIFLFIIIAVFQFPLQLSTEQYYLLIASGFAGLVFGDSFLFKSFQLIGARLGMLLMALAPAISSVLAFIFLDENLSLISIVGIAVTLTGIVLVVLEKDADKKSIIKISGLGVLFGLFAALGQASGLVLAKVAFEIGDVNGFVAAFVRLFAAVAIILPAMVLLKRFRNPYKVFKNDAKAFKATIIGTILGPVLGITGSLIAITYTKIGIASTLMSTMPVIMLPISKYYYKENITWRAVLGAVIAVAGVSILFLS